MPACHYSHMVLGSPKWAVPYGIYWHTSAFDPPTHYGTMDVVSPFWASKEAMNPLGFALARLFISSLQAADMEAYSYLH